MTRLLLSLLLLTPLWVNAATLYCGPSATGNGSGSDFNNRMVLPNTTGFVRGNTYVIIEGSYGGRTFSRANSGTTLITIRKGNATQDSGVAGWSSSLVDGQATFGSNISITTSYWVIDGHTRSTDWKSGYGIRVGPVGGKVVTVGGNNVTLRYVEILGIGPSTDANDGFYAIVDNTYLTVQYCRLYNFGRAPFLGRGLRYFTVEYCWVERNESTDLQHSEGVSLYGGAGPQNCIFRHNIWVDIEGTGVIVVGNASNCEFYGNLIYWTPGYPTANGQYGGYTGNGAITSWTVETISNSKFYNNTIILPSSGGVNFSVGNVPGSTGSGNTAYNNVFWSSGTIGTRISFDDGTTHNYNAFGDSNARGEGNAQINLGNVFVNSGSYDFRLDTATTAGTTLGSPYNVDLLGTARGADGTFDRGAYEFLENESPDEVPPTVDGAAIDATGQALTLTFSEPTTGSTGFNLSATNSLTLSDPSGSGTGVRTFTITPAVLSNATVTLNYSAGNIVDEATNALATISGRTITNNSEVVVEEDLTDPQITVGGSYISTHHWQQAMTANLSGTVSDDQTIQAVTIQVVNAGGVVDSGEAEIEGDNWTYTAQLHPGRNLVTAQALDADGNTASVQFLIYATGSATLSTPNNTTLQSVTILR